MRKSVAWLIFASFWGCGVPTATLMPVSFSVCRIEAIPSSLDFGTVSGSAPATRQLTLANLGEASCDVSGLALGPASDPGFALGADDPTSLILLPGTSALITVTFDPRGGSSSLMHSGLLTFESDDPANPTVDVSLIAATTSTPPPPTAVCQLAISPSSLSYGTLLAGTLSTEPIVLTNSGDAACTISQLGLESGSDPAFTLLPSQNANFVVPAHTSASVYVTFDTSASDPSGTHTGALVLLTSDPFTPTARVPLSATTVTCRLSVAPVSLDFGTVLPGVPLVEAVTLTNGGDASCQVAGLGLSNDSDSAFSLPASQPMAFAVPAGGNATVSVTFASATNSAPYQRTGTLTFQTGDPTHAWASVALSATLCGKACQSGIGCSDGTREGFADQTTYPHIAGCGGAWTVAGMHASSSCSLVSGNDSSNPSGAGCAAADLCAGDFHICASQDEVTSNLPSGETCTGAASVLNLFFASGQSGPGCSVCMSSNVCSFSPACPSCDGLGACENDLFGCGTMGSSPDLGSCGVFNRSSGDQCNSLPFGGWSCMSPAGIGPTGSSYEGGCTELSVVTKSDGLSGGGVLCCAN